MGEKHSLYALTKVLVTTKLFRFLNFCINRLLIAIVLEQDSADITKNFIHIWQFLSSLGSARRHYQSFQKPYNVE